MKYAIGFLLLFIVQPLMACEGTLLDQDFRRLAARETVNLCETYRGQVILVVNTASKCGNTPQYDGLEAMYEQYRDQGFVVLGFPSNDFFGQEPGSEEQIEEFCRLTYGVEFPMFEKVSVKEDNAHPFYHALAEQAGTYPTWNFHKFLIGRDGEYIAQFSPRTKPADEQLVAAVEQALADR